MTKVGAKSGRWGSFRTTRLAGVVVLAGSVFTWVVSTPAGAAPDPGQGSASAVSASITPRDGSLAVGVTLGEALAGHTNGIAKAASQGIDLGAVGTSLTSQNCGQAPTVQPSQIPQTVTAETGQPGSSAGNTGTDGGAADKKFALANAVPYGEAITTIAPIGMAGIIDIGATVSRSWSGLVNGQRQAGATTDIAGITLPGGVSLSGLHWQATYQTTGTPDMSGSFSVGHISVAGIPLPISNVIHTLTQLNTVLAPLGLQFSEPTSHIDQGTMYVDPLQISVVPSTTRDSALNTVLTGIRPVQLQLTNAVLKAFCQADTFTTVADVAIAAISGGGSMQIALGGVQASSGTLPNNGFNLSLGTFSLGGASSGTPAVPGTPGFSTGSASLGSVGLGSGGTGPALGSSPSSTPTTATKGSATSSQALGAVRPASALGGKRGGALALVGLIGLGLLALVAEGDRRKMRAAQRTVTFKE